MVSSACHVTSCDHHVCACRGTNHYNQTDIPFVLPRFVMRSDKYRSPLDPVVAHTLNMELVHGFLKRHLLLGKATPTTY